MVFRFKPLKITNPKSDWSQPITDKLIADVIKSQMKSTYGSDYVNNVDAKREFEERVKNSTMPTTLRYLDWKEQRREEQRRLVEAPLPISNPFSYESL